MSTRLEDHRPAADGTAPPPSTPDRSHYRELARHLRGVGVVNRELARRLPHDCPPASAGLLTLLHRHGEVRMSRLTELLAIDLSVTSRQVAHAEERGWIERLPDPHDGRSRLLRLTESGQRKLDELSELTTETMREFLTDWSTEDLTALTSLLDRLGTAFGDCRTRGGGADAPPATPAPRSPAAGDSASGGPDSRTT